MSVHYLGIRLWEHADLVSHTIIVAYTPESQINMKVSLPKQRPHTIFIHNEGTPVPIVRQVYEL